MKKDNTGLWIIGIVIAVVLIYGGSKGWFKSTTQTTYITNETTINLLENKQNVVGTCSLSANPTTTTLGGVVNGEIRDGAVKDCNVYYKHNGGQWTFHATVKTNIDGVYSGQQLIPDIGNYEFKAVCGDCVTNSVVITATAQSRTCMEKALDMGINFNAQPNTPSETECMRIATNMCGNNGIKTKVFTISDGCCLWECNQVSEPIIPTPKCFENDGGANPSIFSTCYDTSMGKMVEFLTKRDSCDEGIKGRLTEWYCENDICKSKFMECGFTGMICSEGYCHQLLCSDIKDPFDQRDCDKGESGCRGDCSYVYNYQTDTDSCECVSRCSTRHTELDYDYYFYYDKATYPYPDGRRCSVDANHQCVLLGKTIAGYDQATGKMGDILEGRCCMWNCQEL